MTERQIAVYTVIIDLIYDHGGETPDDPKHISSYFADMGTASARNTIQQLVDMGKVYRIGDMLHQKRAENEAKTREKLSETRAKVGRLGGVSSGFSRRAGNDNNNISEASALSKHEAEKEKIREEEKREAKASPKKAPFGSRLDADWFLPKAWGEWALGEGLDQGEVRLEADRFKDYWISVAGAKGRKADWQATWRNWIRKHLADKPKDGKDGDTKGGRRLHSWLAGSAISPRVDSWPDTDPSQPLLARR
jgi:hypothetical protein